MFQDDIHDDTDSNRSEEYLDLEPVLKSPREERDKSPREERDKSPFEERDHLTDVTFLVEGRELHFCKSFLTASSPVFEKMFSSDFKEKESSTIPLPDKTYEEMAIFLQQFHPAHSWKPINDDILESILPLADEYQTEHVRLKCQHYITTQLVTNAIPEETLQLTGPHHRKLPPQCFRTVLDPDQVLLYLRICDEHKLSTSLQELTLIASGWSVAMLTERDNYKRLSNTTKLELMTARCRWLELR